MSNHQEEPLPEFARVKDLFDRAIALPPDQRAAFVHDAAGGDTALAEQVLRLCDHHQLARTEELAIDLQDLATRGEVVPAAPPPTIGPYVLHRHLGSGGMGEVHLAFDPRLRRQVAIKLLAAPLRGSPTAVERFLREAKAAAALDHPGIGKVHEVSEADAALPYFAMEFVPGRPLDQVITRLRTSRQGASTAAEPTMAELRAALGGASPEALPGRDGFALVAGLIARIARALQHAHERGVVHRDVKPHNVIVRPDGQPVLLDFGLARFDTEPGLTRPGEFVGTPLYASPEQVSARRLPVDHRTDVYSLGATLFELVALEPPFTADSTGQLLRDIELRLAPSLRSRRPGTPRDLDAICAMALAKEPQQRYATAGEFADDLERFAAGVPVTARSLGPWTRVVRWSRRRPAAAAVLVLALLLVATVVAASTVLQAQQQTKAALAAARYASARRFLGEGDIAAALAEVDSARTLGYPDSAALLVTEFEAHESRGDFEQAHATLACIDVAPQEPALAARLLLLRGDFAVDRVSDPEAGLDAVAAALATGALGAADAAYARCLLAPDLDTAWQHMQQALDAQPGHRRAGLAAVWLALGRGDAAAAMHWHAEFLRRFRGDAIAPLLGRALKLCAPDVGPAPEPDPEPAAGSGSRSLQSVELLLDALALARDVGEGYAEVQHLEVKGNKLAAAWAAGKRVPSLGRRVRAVQQGLQRLQQLGPEAETAGVALHPVLVRAWQPLLFEGTASLVAALSTRERGQESRDLLARCATHVDDGFFHLLAGHLHGRAKQPLLARREFQLAIDRPSLIAARRHALRIMVTLDAGFAAGLMPGLTRDDVRHDLQRNTLTLLACKDLDETEWNIAFTAPLFVEDWELANRIAADWRRSAPTSTDAIKAEMDLACRRGELFRARRCALEGLAIDDRLWWARQVRDETESLLQGR